MHNRVNSRETISTIAHASSKMGDGKKKEESLKIEMEQPHFLAETLQEKTTCIKLLVLVQKHRQRFDSFPFNLT